MPWYDTLCHDMPCYVMLCHVMSCYMSCYVLCYVSCYVMLCHVMCYVMSCYVMICHVMSCYVMICHVVCHVMCQCANMGGAGFVLPGCWQAICQWVVCGCCSGLLPMKPPWSMIIGPGEFENGSVPLGFCGWSNGGCSNSGVVHHWGNSDYCSNSYLDPMCVSM